MAELTEQQLLNRINTLLADNSNGDISAEDVRNVFVDMLDSLGVTIHPSGQGPQGDPGTPGTPGTNGWTLGSLSIVSDGERRVVRLGSLVGGSGTRPSGIENMFIGATGLVATAAQAVDIRGMMGAQGQQGATGARGAQGAQGDPGTPGAAGRDGRDGMDGAAGAPGADGQGVPTGGTSGQVLSKIDATDYNTQWIDAPSGGGSTMMGDGYVEFDEQMRNVTTSDANQWYRTGLIVGDWGDDVITITIFNLSSSSAPRRGVGAFQIKASEFRGMTAIPPISGFTFGDVQVNHDFRTIIAPEAASSITGHTPSLYAIGRNSNNEIMVATDGASDSPSPIKLSRMIVRGSISGGGGGGSSTFIGLSDTPTAFGTSGQILVVNPAGDALVFADNTGGAPKSPAPSITGFSIRGVSSDQTAPYRLSGSQTFDFIVHNPSSVDGNLTLSQAGTSLSTSITPTSTSTSVNINAIALTAGQSVTFTLSGTATSAAGGAPFSVSFTITATASAGNFYTSWESDRDITGFDPATGGSVDTDNLEDPQVVTIPAAPSGVSTGYLAFLQPQSQNDFSVLNIGGLNQLPGWQKVNETVTINGVVYEAYVSINLFRISLWVGQIATITRS